MSSRASRPVVLAPGALSSVGAYAPGRGGRVRDLPAVDARLVVPESHTEMVDGVVYQTMGANPPHATQHAQVARLFGDCLAPGQWVELAVESEICDRCFVVPIPVRAFVRRVLAHDTVARALLATGNAVIIDAVNAARDEGLREGRTEGLRDGRTDGLREALRAGFAVRGWTLTTQYAARITECTDAATLLRWTQRIFTAQRVDDVFE